MGRVRRENRDSDGTEMIRIQVISIVGHTNRCVCARALSRTWNATRRREWYNRVSLLPEARGINQQQRYKSSSCETLDIERRLDWCLAWVCKQGKTDWQNRQAPKGPSGFAQFRGLAFVASHGIQKEGHHFSRAKPTMRPDDESCSSFRIHHLPIIVVVADKAA